MTQTTECPRCGEPHCIVRETIIQATRYEPARSLGWQAYCRPCDCYFKVSAPLVQSAFEEN